jgi:alpha-tubulin suppressor-like RCC1 family protein
VTRLDLLRLRGLASVPGARRVVGALLWAAAVGGCSERTSPPPLPAVSSVSPANGPLSGGTAVTIVGRNFPVTVDSVRLGSGRLGSLLRVSATQLTGTTPTQGAPGTVDVVVFTTGAGSGTCAGCYAYNPPPTVTGVAPANGPGTGGTTVTISGTNFVNVTAVTIGSVALQNFSVVSSTQIAGVTAASATSGANDVVVRSSSHGLGTCTGCFTFISWAKLAAGLWHTCGVLSGGAAYCWGSNSDYQLAHGTGAGSSTPVAVTGGLAFASLTAGDFHTCGLTSGGTAYCWGDDSYGELGDGSTGLRSAPVPVAGGLTFVALTAGGSHTCGLTSGGTAFCWGDNGSGDLGDGSTTTRSSPIAVTGGLTFATLIAGFEHTCGLTAGGAAYCWGSNYNGELGNGSNDILAHTTPVPVAGGLTFASLTAGWYHTCGVTSSGAAYCWGYNTIDPQLGDSSNTDRYSPVRVKGGLTFTSVTAGNAHTCGVTHGGAAYCWGDNTYGELGDGSTANRTMPVPVAGGRAFANLTVGWDHTCGVTTGGAAYCWGGNGSGELGDSTTAQRLTPVEVVNP